MVTVYEQVYIPDSLLAGCPPVLWEGGTYRQAGELAAMRKTALADCDARFTAAREYQDRLRKQATDKAL